jgi:hypothetical protein
MKAKATELKISKICNECVNYNNVREVHTFLGNGELCRGIAGGNILSDITQIHRMLVNFILLCILVICGLVGFFSITHWLLFPNRCKTPFSYLVLWCGVDDLMDSDYKKTQFMDSLPKYFYKKEQ